LTDTALLNPGHINIYRLIPVLAVIGFFVFNAAWAQDHQLQREHVARYLLLEQAQDPTFKENLAPPTPNYDLSLASIDVVDGYYLSGDTIEPLFFINNLGTATSPQPVSVGFYLSIDTTITVDDLSLGAISIPSIAGGKTIAGIVSITLPPLSDGAYYIGAIISLEDKNSLNNSNHDTLAFNVDSSRTSPADLALLLADSPNGLFRIGDVLDMIYILDNIGDRSSNSFKLKWYASTDTAITTNDILLNPSVANGLILGLPPSAGGVAIEFLDPLPGSGTLPDGTYYVGGIIEPSITENNSSNHVAFDPEVIKISNSPEIRVRPQSLSFIEESVMQTESFVNSASATTIRINTLQNLRQQAKTRGQVRVIVGLDTDFVPEGKLTVHLRSVQRQNINVVGDALLQEMNGLNYRLKAQYQFIPFMALTVDPDALEQLARSPRVTSIERDSLDHVLLASSLSVIGAPVAWAEGYDGSGWAVAVLDTGVDKSHPWFSTNGAKVISEACYSTNETGVSESFCPDGMGSSTAPGSGVHCDITLDGCDHGTHVAGIVAGNDGAGPNYGVARGADIIAMQVFTRFLTEDDCGIGEAPCTLATGSDQVRALERVYELRDTFNIAALNMSLGGGRFFDSASCDLDSPATRAAIDLLRSVGIASVIASGNDGYQDSISSPACISSAISVGATTDNDNVSVFSNIYPGIHLLAPGVSIDSSVPGGGLGNKSGTSMATPHVAGAWAVLKQERPTASVDDVLIALTDTATLVDDERGLALQSMVSQQTNSVSVTGLPRINLDQALQSPPTTFTIYNDGGVQLTVDAITPDMPASWIDWTPRPPFNIPSLGLKVVKVSVDYTKAPMGESTRRLDISSNDISHSPYPGGVDITVKTLPEEPIEEIIHTDGFEGG
jgi:subtilisin family serine protease